MSTYIQTLTKGDDYIAPRTKIEAVENLQTSLNAKVNTTENSLTTESKLVVGAINEVDANCDANTTELGNTVKFTAQTLTEAQKAQARNNIGAGSATGGDMLAATYDPNAHASDIFAYADSAVSTHNSSSSAHSSLFADKVDKVSGKGLSTNDYDATEKQKVTDAYADKHTHTNKSVLDAITSALVSAWTTASTWVSTNGATLLAHIADLTIHTTSSEKATWNAKSTVSVSASGSATDEIEYITVDGVQKKIKSSSGGTQDFEELNNRPKYNGSVMTGDTNIPEVPDTIITKISAGTGINTDTTSGQALIALSSETQTSLAKADTALQSVPNTYRTSAAQDVIDATKANASDLTSHTGNTSNPHSVTKSQVGLGNVDNTSDANKPISTATQTALDAKQNTLTFDNTPTAGSTNPVTSGGVYTALAGKVNTTEISLTAVGTIGIDSSGLYWEDDDDE